MGRSLFLHSSLNSLPVCYLKLICDRIIKPVWYKKQHGAFHGMHVRHREQLTLLVFFLHVNKTGPIYTQDESSVLTYYPFKNELSRRTATSYPGSFHYAPRWRKDPGPGWSSVSQILGDNNWDLWGVGEANVAFEFKTIQGVCHTATQRTTMKRSFYWHVFFIKYAITVIVRDEVVNKAWLDV